MAEIERDDLGKSVGAILLNENGALLNAVVATDGESFYSVLSPIPDIAAAVFQTDVPGIYSGNFWITAFDRDRNGNLFVADADGRVHTNLTGSWTIENVTLGKGLRTVRCLPDGTILTAGTSGTIFRREPTGWLPMNEPVSQWINDIDGAGELDFVAVGDAGLVLKRVGTGWDRPEIPTNATLHGVLSLGKDYLVCGAKGAIFRSDGTAWRDLSFGSVDLFGMREYRQEIWIACGTDGAGVLTDDGIEARRQTFAAYSIDTAGQFIAFAGNNIVVRHDGSAWHGFGYT